jgi:3-oxoacyl-[acyl-carrier-protein] synthase-3
MTDGGGENTIIIPDGGYRNMVSPDSFKEHEFEGGIKRNNLNLFMQGDDVFAFVIGNVPKATKIMFEHFGINPNKIDYYLIHHASKFIINKLKKKLSISEEKAPLQLNNYGNSSNVSIPLLMCTCIKDDVTNRALNMYISGFGVGLSLGVGVITTNGLKCADLIEM